MTTHRPTLKHAALLFGAGILGLGWIWSTPTAPDQPTRPPPTVAPPATPPTPVAQADCATPRGALETEIQSLERQVADLTLAVQLETGRQVAREGEPTVWPEDLPERFHRDGAEAHLSEHLDRVDGEMVDLDCRKYPCLAYVELAPADPPGTPESRAEGKADLARTLGYGEEEIHVLSQSWSKERTTAIVALGEPGFDIDEGVLWRRDELKRAQRTIVMAAMELLFGDDANAANPPGIATGPLPPPVARPVQQPVPSTEMSTCADELATVVARRDALVQELQLLTDEHAELVQINNDAEGEFVAWPPEHAAQQADMEEAINAVVTARGGTVFQLDCGEYPCVATITAPHGQTDAHEVPEDLRESGYVVTESQVSVNMMLDPWISTRVLSVQPAGTDPLAGAELHRVELRIDDAKKDAFEWQMGAERPPRDSPAEAHAWATR